MSDQSVIHIGENSPEKVAIDLLKLVAISEGKKLIGSNTNADRKWILDTYAECFRTVQGNRPPVR